MPYFSWYSVPISASRCRFPSNAEAYKFMDFIQQNLELISGINSVNRGQPEASLKSGTALALIDSKAVQHATPFIQAYQDLLIEVSTCIINFLQDFASEEHERVIAVAGKHQVTKVSNFLAEDINNVDRVYVESASALTKTLAGRVELANQFAQQGMITSTEEYYTVIETGSLETLTQALTAQADLIRDENERMIQGEAPVIAATDDHMRHVREHSTLLSKTDIRKNNQAVALIQGHIMEHMQQFMNPGINQLQVMLGYQSAPLAAPAPEGNVPGPKGDGSTPVPPGDAGQPPEPEAPTP